MEIRSSDRELPRVRVHPVTAGELMRMSVPALRVAKPGVLATPMAMPSMHDLAKLARDLTNESSLWSAVRWLQRELCRVLRVSDALCVWIDWPRDAAWTLTGKVGPQVHDLVTQVAGRGRREVLGSTLVEPLGPPPSRAVLALRKSPGVTFGETELVMISALGAGIAPTLDKLIASARP
ncbi:MAG TPA: hypothetical protein VFQ53_43180 [Kofleriaceae bacterium]|nr:hypothetical protein [Kofleriaceae bacterium]